MLIFIPCAAQIIWMITLPAAYAQPACHLADPSRGWHFNWWEIAPTRAECFGLNLLYIVPYAIGNFVVFLAYLIIPIQFLRVAKHRSDKWLTKEIIWAAAFILFCGASHLINVVLLFANLYPFAIAWDFVTGFVSWHFVWLMAPKVNILIDLPDRGEIEDLQAAYAEGYRVRIQNGRDAAESDEKMHQAVNRLFEIAKSIAVSHELGDEPHKSEG